jgi:hypothetical protein
MGTVADTTRAELRARGREAERRREAAAALRIGASLCEYTAEQVGNGLTPQDARRAVVEVAAELADLAEQLRRLARLRPADRRSLAAAWAGLGMSRTEIARRLGVSDRAVYYYVRGRPSP